MCDAVSADDRSAIGTAWPHAELHSNGMKNALLGHSATHTNIALLLVELELLVKSVHTCFSNKFGVLLPPMI